MIRRPKKPLVAKSEPPIKPTRSQLIAKVSLQPAYRSASVIAKFDGDEDVDFFDLSQAVKEQSAAIQAGNMENAEAMLATQAITLDSLFANLARRAGSNMEAGHGEAAERYMKLALRAQAQCAKTIQTMGELNNPRQIAFVKQANIAHNQQVNNGKASRAENFEIQQNKLIDGATDDLPMDARTAQTAGGSDQKLEAVGKIIRP
jgi:hypothetical protein